MVSQVAVHGAQMREAFFHEDDYCQIEVLPVSNWDYCTSQLQSIGQFSEAHSNGIGWTDIYLRDQNPQRMASLNISTTTLASVLNTILPSYDRVLTGYSSYREESKHTLAFGSETACIVFAGYDSNNIVQDIWLDLGLADEAGQGLALSGLLRLAEMNDLLLVDWSMGELIHLSNAEQIKMYFADRTKSRAHALGALRQWIDSQDK